MSDVSGFDPTFSYRSVILGVHQGYSRRVEDHAKQIASSRSVEDHAAAYQDHAEAVRIPQHRAGVHRADSRLDTQVSDSATSHRYAGVHAAGSHRGDASFGVYLTPNGGDHKFVGKHRG